MWLQNLIHAQVIPGVAMDPIVKLPEHTSSRMSTSGPWTRRSVWPSVDVPWSRQPIASPTRSNVASLRCREKSKNARGHRQASQESQGVKRHPVSRPLDLRQSPAQSVMPSLSTSLNNTLRFQPQPTVWSNLTKAHRLWSLMLQNPTPSPSISTQRRSRLNAMRLHLFCLLY